MSNAAPAKYLQRFGLPFEFLAGYGVGYDLERELIIVPHSQAFFTSVYIGDPNKPCPIFQFKGRYEFFNYQALDYEFFVVTENVFDALMLEYTGLQTVAIGSSANKECFVDVVLSRHAKNQMALLAFGEDENSRKLSDWLKESLRSRGFFAADISKEVSDLIDPKKYKNQEDRRRYVSFGLSEDLHYYAEEKKEFDEEWRLTEFNRKCRREFFDTDKTDGDNAARILYVYGKQCCGKVKL